MTHRDTMHAIEDPTDPQLRAPAYAPQPGVHVLPLRVLRLDGSTQARTHMDAEVVAEYAETMQAGAVFPAVHAMFDGVIHWVYDGWHRVQAAERAGYTAIAAHVQPGTQRDATLAACGANATHGLRRTNADKRRAAEVLLRDPEWNQWSDREIARRCGVNQSTVSRIRHELASTDAMHQCSARRTSDGRVMDVRGIAASNGHRAQPSSPPDPLPRLADKRIAALDELGYDYLGPVWNPRLREVEHAIQERWEPGDERGNVEQLTEAGVRRRIAQLREDRALLDVQDGTAPGPAPAATGHGGNGHAGAAVPYAPRPAPPIRVYEEGPCVLCEAPGSVHHIDGWRCAACDAAEQAERAEQRAAFLQRMEALARQVPPALLRLGTWALFSSKTGRRTDLLGLHGAPPDDEIDAAVLALPDAALPAVHAALLAVGLWDKADAESRQLLLEMLKPPAYQGGDD